MTIGSGVGKLLGFRSGQKAKQQQKRANQLAAKNAAIQNVLARRRALAAVRRQEATIQAAAIAQGQGSSISQAGLSSLQSQAAAAESNQRFGEDIAARTRNFQAKADKWNRRVGYASTFSSLMDTGASLAKPAVPSVDATAGQVEFRIPPTPNPHTR